MIEEFNAFKKYLDEKESSPYTVRGYLQDLRTFAKWFEETNAEDFSAQAVTPTDLREYRRDMKRKKRAPTTTNRHLAALSAYFSWLVEKGDLDSNPSTGISALPLPNPQPRWLDKKEQFSLMRTVEKDLQLAKQRYPKRWIERQRDYALVVLLLNTGLRLSEAVALEISDLDISERKGSLLVRAGKGNKQRGVPLNVDARKALQSWLEVRPERKDNDFIFISLTKESAAPLTSRSLERTVERYGAQAKLKKLTPHVLRHTFAKNLVNNGVSLEKVATLLGHKSLNTTRIYITPGMKDLEEAVAKLASR